MNPRVIADYKNIVGEGPLWHTQEKRLYWGDIVGGKLFRYDPETSEHELFFEGPVIGGFTIQSDGSQLLFMEYGKVAILNASGELSTVIERLPGEEKNRFNDVIADPLGRVFCGTMALDSEDAMSKRVTGKLYRLDTDGTITELLDGIGISNGLGFTPDRKQMYYTDSVENAIYIFDYHEASGDISNQRIFVNTPSEDHEGVPDGMTVDAEGYIWSARAGGGKLVRYSSNGREDLTVHFPTANIVSSVTFGGPDMTDIFVTTIGGDKRPEAGPEAGSLFQLNLGVVGVPDFKSQVRL